MEKKTKKQELVARPHLLPLVFYLYDKRVKIYLNRKDTKFPVLTLKRLGKGGQFDPRPQCFFEKCIF